MKAHEIMMFLLLFNLVMWLLGGYGLNIYNIGVTYDVSDVGTDVLEGQSENMGLAFLQEVAEIALVATIGSIAGLAIIGYILRAQPSPQSIIYALFVGLYTVSYVKTLQVFYQMSHTMPQIFFAIFLVFTAITGFTFLFGFSQLVTQSWRYMK